MDMKRDVANIMANLQKEYLQFCYRQVGDENLKMTEVLCILFLHRGYGDTSSEIARKYMLSPSLVSKSVDALRNSGYLSMERDERDSRRWRLHLTEKSRPITEKLTAAQELFDRTMAEGIPEQDMAAMQSVADRLNKNLEAIRNLR